jgi:protein gp37
MAANSGIEWTGRTWQVTYGCLLKSAGCAHCYAEIMAKRIKAMALADLARGRDPGRKRYYIDAIGDDGRWNGNVVASPEALGDPLGWRKPQVVFVDSMSDLFYGDAEDARRCKAKGIAFTPVPFEFIAAVFGAMAVTRRHTYQVLTKRPGRAAEFFEWMNAHSYPCARAVGAWSRVDKAMLKHKGLQPLPHVMLWPLPNVWLGTSIENQAQRDRLLDLARCPARIRFVSAEPLLGPLVLGLGDLPGIHWVIAGDETHGTRPGRPAKVEWSQALRDECSAAGVAFFEKQLVIGGKVCHELDQFPEGLRVREFPEAVAL